LLSTELDHERRIRGSGERATPVKLRSIGDRGHYVEAAKALGRGPTDGDDRLADELIGQLVDAIRWDDTRHRRGLLNERRRDHQDAVPLSEAERPSERGGARLPESALITFVILSRRQVDAIPAESVEHLQGSQAAPGTRPRYRQTQGPRPASPTGAPGVRRRDRLCGPIRGYEMAA